jgi:hypothetical protein
MIAVLIEYIKIRLHLVQLIGLTILMSMLVLSINDPLNIWISSMLFLVTSFIVFRILDDAFSATIDREEHPERTYLNPSKFKLFKKITVIIIGVYLLSISLVLSRIYFMIFLLFISSLVLYYLFGKQLFVIKLIPLLKYPVLLYCVSNIAIHQVDQGVLFSSFLLMAGFDSFDRVKVNSNHIWIPLLLLFLCSVFLFKPWYNYIDILFCFFPLLIIYRLRKKSITPYFSILFYPITFFILTHLYYE